jgi:hypothetical protein
MINGIKSFREQEIEALQIAVNNHADLIVHLQNGLQRMFHQVEKQKLQIEALLDGHAALERAGAARVVAEAAEKTRIANG